MLRTHKPEPYPCRAPPNHSVAATFSVVSPTEITTTVPAGATTGKVEAVIPSSMAFVSRNKVQTGKEPVKVSLRLAPLDL